MVIANWNWWRGQGGRGWEGDREGREGMGRGAKEG